MDITASEQELLSLIEEQWELALYDLEVFYAKSRGYLSKAEKDGFRLGIGLSKRNIAYYHFIQSQYKVALTYALEAADELHGLDVKLSLGYFSGYLKSLPSASLASS